MEDEASSLDTEIVLISSSLLPTESLSEALDSSRHIEIRNNDNDRLWLHVEVSDGYPSRDAVKIEIKGAGMGREEAEGWKEWVDERMGDWNAEDEYPLYQLLTDHCLRLLAPSSPSPPASPAKNNLTIAKSSASQVPHHVLLTSHHILSPTKRKNLIALSSQLSLVGFAKVGHPGIMYAVGEKEDLTDWLREVKSWNWLALRVRVGVEPVPLNQSGADGMSANGHSRIGTRGCDTGARGGKGRGEWVELEKIAEALEWLKARGRGGMLLDIGMGAGSGSTR